MRKKEKKNVMPSRDDDDFKTALKVLERAAKQARETARRSRTPLALWQDGRVTAVRLDAKTRKSGR